MVRAEGPLMLTSMVLTFASGALAGAASLAFITLAWSEPARFPDE